MRVVQSVGEVPDKVAERDSRRDRDLMLQPYTCIQAAHQPAMRGPKCRGTNRPGCTGVGACVYVGDCESQLIRADGHMTIATEKIATATR
jgi:hypothetical protein